MSKIRVVMLVGTDDSSNIMYSGIKNDFFIERIIVEDQVSRAKFLRSRLKSIGLLKVIGQIFFVIYDKLWLKKISSSRINEIKCEYGLIDKAFNKNKVLRVNSVNNDKTISELKKINPDIVIVNGTRIIKGRVLKSIDAQFINTHMGITPKYRGVHGGYWSLVQGDLENCGVTLHLVDEGIDTGGILYQDIITVSNKDSFNTYPYLQLALAIPLMKKAINNVIRNSYKVQSNDLKSQLWTHPTLLEYLKYRLFKKIR